MTKHSLQPLAKRLAPNDLQQQLEALAIARDHYTLLSPLCKAKNMLMAMY